MKKKILTFILFVCAMIPAIFCLGACSADATTAPDIRFQVANGYIQYYNGEEWQKLIAIDELKGDSDVWTIGNNGYWYKNGICTWEKANGSNGKDGNGIKDIQRVIILTKLMTPRLHILLLLMTIRHLNS